MTDNVVVAFAGGVVSKEQQAEKERIERRRNMPKPSHKTYALMAMMAGLGIGV